ncbi:PIG-L family deacetylase, partial [Schnuerera sp. xch1]|uniref:PIG-L deacetylase family protein n=1 Tax=Schnuerera sp. xch1 TaxID=2874283 RepID=UPI001CBB2DC9
FDTIYFLDELDGRLSSSKQEVVEKILNILDEEQPTIIYTPFLIDGHNDHVETTRSVLRALKLWNKEFDKIYMYEVNCPILPELVNSLSIMDRDLYDKKGDMYHIFSSQWAMGFDSFRLLDKRKSLIAEIGENSYEIYGAETFIRVDVKLLQRIEDMLKEEDFKPGFFRQLSSEYTLLSSFKTNGDLKKKYSYKAKNILASQVTEE